MRIVGGGGGSDMDNMFIADSEDGDMDHMYLTLAGLERDSNVTWKISDLGSFRTPVPFRENFIGKHMSFSVSRAGWKHCEPWSRAYR